MTYNPVRSSRFRKDVVRCAKRGQDVSKLERVMLMLERGEALDPVVNRPHRLVGSSQHTMECHIEGDWLLVYRYDGDDIYYIATGTHSDLFH